MATTPHITYHMTLPAGNALKLSPCNSSGYFMLCLCCVYQYYQYFGFGLWLNIQEVKGKVSLVVIGHMHARLSIQNVAVYK